MISIQIFIMSVNFLLMQCISVIYSTMLELVVIAFDIFSWVSHHIFVVLLMIFLSALDVLNGL